MAVVSGNAASTLVAIGAVAHHESGFLARGPWGTAGVLRLEGV